MKVCKDHLEIEFKVHVLFECLFMIIIFIKIRRSYNGYR